MINSMTAYARSTLSSDWGNITWEIRAVNHRYCELSLRLPDQYRHLEPQIRNSVNKKINRGKLDITLKFQANSKAADRLVLNKGLAAQLNNVVEELCDDMPKPKVDISKLLSWPGLLTTTQTENKELDSCFIDALDQAINKLSELRASEGQTIYDCLSKLMTELDQAIKNIAAAYPAITERLRSKLQTKLDELAIEINKDRLEQEIIYWLNKMDIAEEIQRFQAHVVAVQELLNSNEPVGRKLDFYAQELNREANTIGSKLADMDIAKQIVHIKVAIEQLREQAQNIE